MFPISSLISDYGNGTFKALYSRPNEQATYIVDITNDDKYVYWSPTICDTYKSGTALFELQYEVDNIVAKSVLYKGTIDDGLILDSTPPSPFKNYIEQINELIEETADNINKYPYIDEENYHWYKWDSELDVFVDTGIDARGLKGEHGSSGVALQREEPEDEFINVWISIDDENNNYLQIKDEFGVWKRIDSLKGDKGDPGIPGSPGQPGLPGFSPSVKVQQDGDDAVIIAIDAEGQTTATVRAGRDLEASKENIIRALNYTPANDDAVVKLNEYSSFTGTIDATSGHIIPNPNGNSNEAVSKEYVDSINKVRDVLLNNLSICSDGIAKINVSTIDDIKNDTSGSVITPDVGMSYVFYNLSKIAGDTTQLQSHLPVGQYTSGARSKIKQLFGLRNKLNFIQSITLDSSVNIISRQTYSGTTPYNFDYLYVEISYPSIDANCDIQTQISIGDNQQTIINGPVLSFNKNAKQYSSFLVNIDNGVIYSQITSPSSTINDVVPVYSSCFMIPSVSSANVDNYISGIKFVGVNNTMLYSGMNFKIYAVNA